MKKWIWSHLGNSSWSKNSRYDKNYKNIAVEHISTV